MEKLNLYQKISEVMRDVAYLTKDDVVGKGSSSYKAITEEKVTKAVRTSLIKNGLVILPIEQITKEEFAEYEKESYGKVEKKQRLLTKVDVKYKIINIDIPTEFEILVSSGSGVDSQDKGVGKAMTYAYKYMLLRTFAIPTGEDPDKISNEQLEEENNIITTNKKVAKSTATRDNTHKSTNLTDAQIKRLYTLGNIAGFDSKKIDEQILTRFDKKAKELTKAEYDTVCNGYENLKNNK